VGVAVSVPVLVREGVGVLVHVPVGRAGELVIVAVMDGVTVALYTGECVRVAVIENVIVAVYTDEFVAVGSTLVAVYAAVKVEEGALTVPVIVYVGGTGVLVPVAVETTGVQVTVETPPGPTGYVLSLFEQEENARISISVNGRNCFFICRSFFVFPLLRRQPGKIQALPWHRDLKNPVR
jgi:hypothetical protein